MSELSMFVVIAIVVIIIAIIAIIGNSISDRSSQEYERPEERAGREGEYIAINIIRRVLRNGDVLLTNVDISYDGRKAELDNVIINIYGVFIFIYFLKRKFKYNRQCCNKKLMQQASEASIYDCIRLHEFFSTIPMFPPRLEQEK